MEMREYLLGRFDEGWFFLFLFRRHVKIASVDGLEPHDIDVVTFAVLGDEASQRETFGAKPELINPDSKTRFKVDHYILPIDRKLDEAYARRIGYWYSMWAHQRETMRFKGFISVNLVSNDEEAIAWLNAQNDHEGGAA